MYIYREREKRESIYLVVNLMPYVKLANVNRFGCEFG